MKARAPLGDEAGVLVEQLEEIPLARQQFAEKHARPSLFVEEFTGAGRPATIRSPGRARPPITIPAPATTAQRCPQRQRRPDLRESPHLAVRGLACRRGERLLFSALDLSVEAGRIVWLRGANGHGQDDTAADPGRPVGAGSGNDHLEQRCCGPTLRLHRPRQRLEGRPERSRVARLPAAPGGPRADARADRQRARTLRDGQPARRAGAQLVARAATTRRPWPGSRPKATPRPGCSTNPFDALDATGIETLNALLAAHHPARRQRRPDQPCAVDDRRSGAEPGRARSTACRMSSLFSALVLREPAPGSAPARRCAPADRLLHRRHQSLSARRRPGKRRRCARSRPASSGSRRCWRP